MRQNWVTRASVMVPAVVSAVALALPWHASASAMYMIDGPAVTSTDAASPSGFTVLETYKIVIVLVTAGCACLVALFSRDGGLWAGALHGAAGSMVAVIALVTDGVTLGAVVMIVAGLVVLVRAAFEGGASTLFVGFMVLVSAAVMTGGTSAPEEEGIEHVASGRFDSATRLLPVNGTAAVLDKNEVKRVEDGNWTTLVRIDDPDVTVLGIAGDRLVYYRADKLEVRIVPLGGGEHAVLTGVVGVDSMTRDGDLLLRTAGAPIPNLRRIDVTRAGGHAHADSLDEARVPGVRPLLETDDPRRPMVFHENPRSGEIVALDNTELGRAVLVGARPNAARWEPLTGGGGHKDCIGSVATPFLGEVDALGPDDIDGWWLHDRSETTSALLNVGQDGYLRDLVRIPRDVVPHALLTGADGALYLLAVDGLWRLPSARDLLAPKVKAPGCDPYPFVADPVRLEPSDPVAMDSVPDGAGGTWRQGDGLILEHRNARGEQVDTKPGPVNGKGLAVDLSGGVPFVGRCPPTRLVDGEPTEPAALPADGPNDCWDALVTGRDGRGWAVVDGILYSFGPGGVVQLTHGLTHTSSNDAVALRLARGEAPDAVPLDDPSLAFGKDGLLLILTDDVLLGVTDQGVVVLGQDDRLWDMTLVATEDGPVVRTEDGTTHRLGY